MNKIIRRVKQIKLEFFYWRKCIFEYHQFWHYIYNKYILAPKILKLNKVLEKPVNQPDLSMHILTCHRDLIMAIWSLASFYLNSFVIGQLYIYNDGSLTEKDKIHLKQFFPSAKILNFKENQEEILNKVKKYSAIYNFRKNYKNFSFKKIVDLNFSSDERFHLILDSDVMWFKNPQNLWQELDSGTAKSFMQKNNVTTHILTKENKKVRTELNAGVIFYASENLNWDKFNNYLENLNTADKNSLRFADQVGYALCLANLNPLPIEKYIISAKVSNQTVAKHYTSPRRPLFYIEGVKKIKNKIL